MQDDNVERHRKHISKQTWVTFFSAFFGYTILQYSGYRLRKPYRGSEKIKQLPFSPSLSTQMVPP